MIKLSVVEMNDGTKYHDVYSPFSWTDMQDCLNFDMDTVIYFKNGLNYKPIILKTDEIFSVAWDTNFKEDNLALDKDADGYLKFIECNNEYYPDYIHPKLKRLDDYCISFFDAVLIPYNLEDGNDIADACVSIVEGFVDGPDINNEEETESKIFERGMAIAAVLASFVTTRLDENPDDKLLRSPVMIIVKEFMEYARKIKKEL